jgi:hypothetical protein
MKCNCYWCIESLEHPARHKQFTVISPDGDTAMVACSTCGHAEPFDPSKHINVADIG